MDPDIPLKTSDEVESIRHSCRLAAAILEAVGARVREGVSTRELDRIAAELMDRLGVVPGVPSGFPGSICTSVDEVAAHGVPSSRKLRRGSIVTVDVAVLSAGWYGDAAATLAVGTLSERRSRLLVAAREAVEAAIGAVRAGARLGDLGAAVRKVAARGNCTILPDLVGHGIGRSLHEEPSIPYTGRIGEGMRIVAGMVFTLEPALGLGSTKIRKARDGWSLYSSDRHSVAQFEHTIAVFAGRTEVLTR
jgi:methionyl aminopeptidase